MLNELLNYMIISLALTIVIECALAWILKIRGKKDMRTVVLVNVLTNPIVVCLIYLAGCYYGEHARIGVTVYAELFAFICEALIYKKALSFKKIDPFVLSLILNATSYLSGLVINRFIY